MSKKVYVESEFAPLRRVILSQSEFIFPKTLKDTEFLAEEAIQHFSEVRGKNFKDVFPKEYEQWLTERENLKTVLEKYEVEVILPRTLTDFEIELGGDDGCSNFFSRDPFFTISELVIEGSLRFPHRRNEILPIRNILEEEASRNDMYYVAIPKPDISMSIDSPKGPFIEGGDVLVYGKTVFVGNSGLASNENGHQWLRNLLKHFGINVVSVPLAKDVLHLDCALSLVRDGLMIVCEEALLEGIPKELSHWDKIQIQKEEIAHLAANGLPVNEQVYILDPFFEKIGKQLEDRGIQTEYIDFSISRSLGGSFRCSTQPLLRV